MHWSDNYADRVTLQQAVASNLPPSPEQETSEQEADREVAELEAILDALRGQSGARAKAKFEETEKELETARIRARSLWSPERQRKRLEARLAKATAAKAKKEEAVKTIAAQLADLHSQEATAKDALAQATAQEKGLVAELAKLPSPPSLGPVPAASMPCPPAGATDEVDGFLRAFSADDEEPKVVEAAQCLRAAAERKRAAAAAAESKHKRPAPEVESVHGGSATEGRPPPVGQDILHTNPGAMEAENHGLDETAIFDGVEGLSEEQRSALAANLSKRRRTVD